MRRLLATLLLAATMAVPAGARLVVPLALVGVLAGGPASGDHAMGHPTDVTFEALPCAAACAPWLAYFSLCGLECDDGDIYFQACDAPFPSFGYDDIEITVPEGADVLRFQSQPVVNWDTFICAPDGEELAVGSDCPLPPYDCFRDGLDCPFPPYNCIPRGIVRIPIATPETMYILVRPGQRVILRAYNWSDPFPLRGTYTFLDVR